MNGALSKFGWCYVDAILMTNSPFYYSARLLRRGACSGVSLSGISSGSRRIGNKSVSVDLITTVQSQF
jgi:hypothetical protein